MAQANSALTFIGHKNRACTMLQSDGFTITGGKKERKGKGEEGGGGNSFSGAFGHSAECESTMKDRCRRTFERERPAVFSFLCSRPS